MSNFKEYSELFHSSMYRRKLKPAVTYRGDDFYLLSRAVMTMNKKDSSRQTWPPEFLKIINKYSEKGLATGEETLTDSERSYVKAMINNSIKNRR